jgi:hypothetical protein
MAIMANIASHLLDMVLNVGLIVWFLDFLQQVNAIAKVEGS